VGEEELKRQFFKKRKEQLMAEQGRIFQLKTSGNQF